MPPTEHTPAQPARDGKTERDMLIRGVPYAVIHGLKVAAAKADVSMESYVRDLLAAHVAELAEKENKS